MARSICPLVFLAVLLAGAGASAQGWMHWPVDRATAARSRLTQGFYGNYISYCGGRDGCGTHNGYDVIMGVGTPLYAVAPGVVDAVNPNDARTADYGNAGRWVRVRHDGSTVAGLGATYFVSYLHLQSVAVAVGAAVTTTTRIGLSGNSGGVGAHLHLHLGTGRTFCGSPVDPGCPTPAYVRGSVVSPSFVDAPGCQSVCRGVAIQWIQPAAYGAEAYARAAGPSCGALDYRGRCEGETLRWCMDGAPMEAACLGRGGVCAWQNDTEGFNCLRCDPALNRPLLPGPRCEGSRFLRCDGTRPVSEDCAATGRTCTPAGCMSPTPPDAGTPTDVGSDIGMDVGNDVGSDIGMDVGSDVGNGPVDGAASDDGARDAGAADGDESMDGGGSREISGGCACRAGAPAGVAGGGRWAALLALAGLALARRRSRPYR
ncbi:MAG: peptidoglycan DD-metalloendopeptidase family protein [Deltaproteobacteria bacterium]|nr:peptidoglycan DD-metalloendopeptidase family protein [Deltaproteobacteria bacterium]